MPEKCNKCSHEIIPSNPILKYNGNAYHSNCLTCAMCNESLGGVKFVREKRGLVCLKCEEKFGLKCVKCKKGFQPGQSYKRLNDDQSSDEKCFHQECFTCSICDLTIPGEFYDRKGQAICIDCHRKNELENTKFCAGCEQVIKYKFIIYKDKPFHQECFKCCTCTTTIQTTSFYKHENQEPICEPCHRDYLAKTSKVCFKCKQLIVDIGVQFENMDFHETCLKCISCNVILDSTVLTNSNKDTFCERCYLERYAKKCQKCTNIINPTIACAIFEGNYFHKECFICDQCGKSIAEEQFVKRDDKFICVNCK